MQRKFDAVSNRKPSVDMSILIVNWNAQELLSRCLASLEGSVGIRIETIVVDNASIDNSVAMIRANFPNVYVIANGENKGFAAANNQAAAQATGRYLLLLNPDTKIPDGSLAELIAYSDTIAQLGAVGPRVINPDGTTQRSCWRGYPGIAAALIDAFYLWKIPGLPFVRNTEISADHLRNVLEVDHILGACMLIPRDVWQEIGPLDEDYFLFLEETDWCRRAKALGKRIVYLPTAEVIHYGQHSMRQQPSRNLPHLYRSYCRFYRHGSGSNGFRMFVLKVVISLAILVRLIMWQIRGFFSHTEKQREQARDMLVGYFQVLRELPSM